MLIKDVYQTFSTEPEIVKPDSSVKDLIQACARNRETRSVHVVDDDRKLLGIVGVRDIMRVVGSRYIERDTVMALPYAMAQTARDIMHEPASVGLEDTIDKALEETVGNWLEDLPVVDAEGRVIGYLDCFEILLNLDK
jgi:CBS domain-containing protein